MSNEIKIKVPAGFEWTGEIRTPNKDEYYYSILADKPEIAYFDVDDLKAPILRKVEKWRDAEVPTVGNFKDWGKKARFRDEEGEAWKHSVLEGYRCDEEYPWRSLVDVFIYCQVLDND